MYCRFYLINIISTDMKVYDVLQTILSPMSYLPLHFRLSERCLGTFFFHWPYIDTQTKIQSNNAIYKYLNQITHYF